MTLLSGVLSGTALTLKFRDEDRSDVGFTCDVKLFFEDGNTREMTGVKLDVYRRFEGKWRFHYLPNWTSSGYLWLGDMTGDQLRELVTKGKLTFPAVYAESVTYRIELNGADAAALLVKLDEWEEKGLLQS